MQINITRIVVLHDKHHTDKVWVHTDLPSPYPKIDTAPLTLSFDTERDTGEEYVLKNFGRTPDEVISI